MSDEYTCETCGETYNKALTEEQAVEQFKEEFPEYGGDTSDCALVCDDCFQKIRLLIFKGEEDDSSSTR